MGRRIKGQRIFWGWGLLVIGTCCLVWFYTCSKQLKHLREVTDLGSRYIKQITISSEPGNRPDREHMRMNSQEIEILQRYLKEADIARVGGHNRSRYKCLLTIEVENNIQIRFLGIVYRLYDWNKDDLYLYRVSSDSEASPGYYKSRKYPVRVKNLGKWLIDYTLKRSAD